MIDQGKKYHARMRAFQAIADPESCEKFIDGHMKVLRIFDIAHITSANSAWTKDPKTYVIIVESLIDDKVFGGARLQLGGGIIPLPIEDAVGDMDPYIFDLVKKKNEQITGEICGLWNSREIAGFGIGSIYLTLAGVALASQVNAKTLFGLCAPATVSLAQKAGFTIETSLGNNGTFYYPKLDLIATAVMLKDTETLEMAECELREEVFNLRKFPVQTKEYQGPKGSLTMEYDLILK